MRAAVLLLLVQAMPAGSILVHGHRGARAMRPENTLPAFEYAIGVGVDFLEMDLAVTKDDVLVVSHDPVLPVEICRGPEGASRVIRELTLAELGKWDCGSLRNPRFPRQTPAAGARVPTLDQVLELSRRGPIQFNIETKIFADRPLLTPSPERFADLLLAAIRRHKLESRVVVQSFDFRTLKAMKKLAPEIRLAALDETGGNDYVAVARRAEARIYSPRFDMVTPEKVKAAQAAGIQVVPWTANTPADWEKLVAAGVDGIITDDPEELIAFLSSKGLR